MASKLKILITSGDHDGVGLEVCTKALNKLGPQKGVTFLLFRGRKRPSLSRRFQRQEVSTLAEAENLTGPLIEIVNDNSPAKWVEQAAQACVRNPLHAMVTAPLSKTLIIASGLKDIGHTEILARISGRQHLYMGFLGKRFNVLLATGHQPLKAAAAQLNRESLLEALEAAERMRSILKGPRRRKPIALVGLNPHAGEQGLIGQEEIFFREAMEQSQLKIEGPLVPDAAFLPQNWEKYSVYVCPYHDQGLIPFKMIHGFQSGVHLTLGLPFVRTSVDHGTAKDLFGKGKANPGSMFEALQAAIHLSKENAL